MSKNFDTAYDALGVLTVTIVEAAKKGGMSDERCGEVIAEIMERIGTLNFEEQAKLVCHVCAWRDLVYEDASTLQIYTCCPEAGCSSYRDTLKFLKRFGLEAKIGLDDDGHFFEVRLPKNRQQRNRFLKALAKRTTKQPPEC